MLWDADCQLQTESPVQLDCWLAEETAQVSDSYNHPEGVARASLGMVLIAKGFGPGRDFGERQENTQKRASKSGMMSVLS